MRYLSKNHGDENHGKNHGDGPRGFFTVPSEVDKARFLKEK